MAMTFDEIKRIAYDAEPPDALCFDYELCAYWTMRYIYAMHNRGDISTTAAKKEAGKTKYVFDNGAKRYEQETKHFKHFAELLSGIESAGEQYAKNRTLENADKFHFAVYGVPIKGGKA